MVKGMDALMNVLKQFAKSVDFLMESDRKTNEVLVKDFASLQKWIG